MPLSQEYLDWVLDQLNVFIPARARRMFGGAGLYSGELFFGVIVDDTLYFFTDESSVEQYRAIGAANFGTHYFAVPIDVLEDQEQLGAWLQQALDAAAKRPPARRRSRRS